ncbi:MAG: response regulator [Gammaproteobacteria bacterium]|nr:response regulator [Gammaproteobacteria bacterium]
MSDWSNMHVLLVDDIKSMRSMIRGILFKVGLQKVSDAADGFEALSVLKQEKIDLIVSDWNMPKMDGLELLKAVRADENYKNIPFLMITAENRKENVVDAIQAGTSEFIAKPFTDGTLREKLNKILK